MNKTLYIRDEDAPVWDRARELAGDKLSPVIVDALKKFVAQKEAEQKGFERIVVEYSDTLDNDVPKKKAFYGRWIIPFKKPADMPYRDGSAIEYSAVAVTAKGNWVVYWKKERPCDDGDGGVYTDEKLSVFGSVSEGAADADAGWAIREAVRVMGVPVEELDI